MNQMSIKSNNVLSAAFAVYLGVLGFFGYVRIWEAIQPVKVYSNCMVERVECFRGKDELGYSSGYQKIFIKGESRPIYLDSDISRTVANGDLVDLKVKRGFPLFGDNLDGEILE